MIISRGLDFDKLVSWLLPPFLQLLLFNSIIAAIYYFDWIDYSIPWLPVSVIATAVAFYTGFKNNQAYDRMWEARKIWGGIVNESRAWGMMVDSYITNLFTEKEFSAEQLHSIKKRLIYRHIAWLYAHRSQLLVPTRWEHVYQNSSTGKTAKIDQKNFGLGLVDDQWTQDELEQYIPADEFETMINYVNTATQLINAQSQDLKELRKQNIIDDFRTVQLEDILRSFHTLQGKNERIKKFPFPRQYAISSTIFVWIFVALLPFSMMPELAEHTSGYGVWLAVPLSSLVGWMYVIMERVGDFTENPFQGLANDIPMLSICRAIEIDLKQMLNEEDLPPEIQSKKGVLM